MHPIHVTSLALSYVNYEVANYISSAIVISDSLNKKPLMFTPQLNLILLLQLIDTINKYPYPVS